MKLNLLILWLAASMSAQTSAGNVLKVHVVNRATGAPVAAATIVLSGPEDGPLLGRTDSEGDFAGRNTSAGAHLLTVTHKGYRMTGGELGKPVEVKVGVETSVTVELLPLAVLAGRVLDQYGDPVRRAIVRTEDRASAPVGREYYESYSSATTDDLGEYRLAEVEPGKHYLAVEYDSMDEARGSGGASRYRWLRTGGLVLYPEATGIEQAEQLQVGPGEILQVNDIRLKIRRAVTVSGTVKPQSGDGNLSLSLTRTNKLSLHSPMVQAAFAGTDGSFKIDVLPGNYVLTATDRKTGKSSTPLALEARETDISGLEMNLTAGYEIGGRIAVDGPEAIDYAGLFLSLGGQPTKIDSSGNFQANLFGGNTTYSLEGLPDDWYIRAARIGGKQIIGRQFDIEPGSTEMTFILSPHGASVSFTVSGDSRSLPTIIVLLVPETGQIPDFESMPHAAPDASGSLIARGVPPGSYRIFSLNASNWALAMRPDLLREKYGKLAPLINVTAGEPKNVVLPIMKIPVE